MHEFVVNSLPKPRAYRRIWRFTLLSAVVHALLGALWLDHPVSTLRLPAPELAVSLSEIAVAPATARALARAPMAAKPASVSESSTASPDAPATRNPHGHVAEYGEQQRRNHLQSLLRAAFEAQFVYPPLARRQGWQGRVQVALRVEADGRFSELRVLRSSGYASLDQDALRTLQRIGQLAQARQWLDGRALHVELPVVYRLLES